MLSIIFIVLLVMFVILFVLPTLGFYILFKTKYKSIVANGNLSEIINVLMSKFSAYGGAYYTQEDQGIAPSSMNTAEALEVLNLQSDPYPTKKEINLSYHKLMQKFHPDKGGSDYLAKKLNEARSILIKK